MSVTYPPIQTWETVVLSAEKLRSMRFSEEDVEPVLDLSTLVVFRNRFGEKRPTLVGFIGCTGSGKSTIFNSLCGQPACITGWKAHNTAGPVMLLSDRFHRTIQDVEQSFAPILFPQWKRECFPISQVSSEAGKPGTLCGLLTPEPSWDKIVLFDLPDINTTRARYEKLLAIELMPWLDTVVFVVDEETLYHRDYEEPVAFVKTMQQRRLCVLNHRGRDRVELNHPDLQGVRDFFGVDTLHVLPDLGSKPLFDREPAFQRFRDDLFLSDNRAPNRPLLDRMAPKARRLIDENGRRQKVMQELLERADQLVRDRVSSEKPVSIHRVLNDDALHVLEHLGLKRFSISNLIQFFKRITTTGALKQSFQIAFANHRENTVTQLLRLDVQKLEEEIIARLSDHREAIRTSLSSHPEARLFGESGLPVTTEGMQRYAYTEDLKNAVDVFQDECQALIASDTLSASLMNDPLLAVGVIIALVVDVLTIHGFGSWLFVPSIFKYIPLGKFEKTKRVFQQKMRDIIRESLMEDIHRLQSARRSITLEPGDPLLKALRSIAGYDEN